MIGILKKRDLLVLFIVVFSLSFVSADIISINPAGSTEFVLTTDKYIEGFFFGIPPEPEPDPDPDPSPGDPTPPVDTVNILVEPREFNINMLVSTNVERTINVTNLGGSEITISVTQEELDGMVILGSDSLTIPAFETVELGVTFVAPSEPGIYSGTINIGGVNVLVTLNVRDSILLFDSSIIVLNLDSTVIQGDRLETLVSLIPMGDPTRLDVTMNFAIRDFSNNIHSTSSETVLVEERVQLPREFNTGNLPPGNYIIGLELVYPGGIAPSSAHFIVVERVVSPLVGKIILFLIIIILIISMILLIILIIKKRRDEEEKTRQFQVTSGGFPVTPQQTPSFSFSSDWWTGGQ